MSRRAFSTRPSWLTGCLGLWRLMHTCEGFLALLSLA